MNETKKPKGINWCIACRIDIRQKINVKEHLRRGHKVQVVEKDPRDARNAKTGSETILPATNFAQKWARSDENGA